MYHTTGLDRDEVEEIVQMIHNLSNEQDEKVGHPPSLGLFNAAWITLMYLRRNTRQVEIAELFECSQPTISRAITAVEPWIERVLRSHVPVADELPTDEQFIVDGSLVPCWSWASHPELYSGKHHTTGLNLQVVCDLSGRLRWISDPVPGARHDVAALDMAGLIDGTDPQNWIGDKGYIGRGMITPIRKPTHRDLLDWEKKHNTAINKIRWMIERTIANLKTWRILHTDYRRPASCHPQTIATVIALEFYRLAA